MNPPVEKHPAQAACVRWKTESKSVIVRVVRKKDSAGSPMSTCALHTVIDP